MSERVTATRGPRAHHAQYVTFRALACMLRVLPPRAAAWCGRALGAVVYACVPSRRRIARENVVRAIGADAGETLVREAFAAGGQLFVECLLLADRAPRIADLVALDGLEHVDAARAGGRGVLFITGHLGNWEVIGPRLVAAGCPTTVLVGKQRNARVDEWLNRGRRAAGQGTVPLAGGGREAMTRLRRGEALGVLIDQRLRRGGVLVPFFGHLAATSPAAARLALASGAAIVPVSIVREDDGVHHRVTVDAPLAFTPSGDRDADVLRLTRAMTQALEEQVRRAPGQYYWFHRRWKPPSDTPALVWREEGDAR